MTYQVMQRNRFFILMTVILLLVLIALFVNIIFGQDIVYTHLFYLPIILAGLWYYKKALNVAVFMGFFHIGINFFQEGMISTSALSRAIILCVIAYVIGTLAEKKDHVSHALSEAQREKSLILENLSELVALQDREQRIIWANPAAAKVFDVKLEELVGKKCYEVWHGRSAPCKGCPVLQALITGGVQRNEMKSSDGRYWNVTGSAVRDESGKIIGAIETALDITERKKAEEELQKLNTELEKRVRERTAELETLNKELKAFNYSVSHDLRAPLYTIEGFSRALLEDYAEYLDDQGRDYLLRISWASQRMSDLIEDLLKLSRVTSHDMRREKVDLSVLVSSCLDLLRQQEPERQAECIVAPGVIVTGDASLLRIVLENLLGNAWKFTKKQEYTRIEFGSTEQNGATVYFISDNGAGFDMQHAEKLFAPFQRLHDPEEYSGTGIGLSIVARIIQRHGGKVWANAEINRGATFYFTLGY